MKLLYLFVFLFFFLKLAISSPVLGIYFGEEYVIFSIKDHGKPFQIVTNLKNEYKFPSQISFDNGVINSHQNIKDPTNTNTNTKSVQSIEHLINLLNTNRKIADHDKAFPEYSFDKTKKTHFYKISDPNNLFRMCKNVTKEVQNNEKENGLEEMEPNCQFELQGREIIAMYLMYLKKLSTGYLSLDEGSHSNIMDCGFSFSRPVGHLEKIELMNASSLVKLNTKHFLNDNAAFALFYTFHHLNHFLEKPKLLLFCKIEPSGVKITISKISEAKVNKIKESNLHKKSGSEYLISTLFKQTKNINFENEIINKLTNIIILDLYQKMVPREIIDSVIKETFDILVLQKDLEKDNNENISADSSNENENDHGNNDKILILQKGTQWEIEISMKKLNHFVEKTIAQHFQLIINRTMEELKLTKDDLDIVQIVQRSNRIPLIKESLQKYFQKSKIETYNMQYFEQGVALGINMYTAMRNSQFHLPMIEVIDLFDKKIYFQYDDGNSPNSEDYYLLFEKEDHYPQKKTLTIRKFDNECQISFSQGTSQKISQVNFKNLQLLLKHGNYNKITKNMPFIHMTVELLENGLFNINRIKFVFEFLNEDGNKGGVDSVGGGYSDSSFGTYSNPEIDVDSDFDPISILDSDSNSDSILNVNSMFDINFDQSNLNSIFGFNDNHIEYDDEDDEDDDDDNNGGKYNWVDVWKMRILNLGPEHSKFIKILNFNNNENKDLSKSKKIIKDFEKLQKQKYLKNEMINKLENQIYLIEETINLNYSKNIYTFFSKKEFEIINQLNQEIKSWLLVNFNNNTIQRNEFKSKLDLLQNKSQIIFNRIQVFKKRPKAIQSLQSTIKESKLEVLHLNETLYYLSDTHVDDFLQFCNQTEVWIERNLQNLDNYKNSIQYLNYYFDTFKVKDIKLIEMQIKNKLKFLQIKPYNQKIQFDYDLAKDRFLNADSKFQEKLKLNLKWKIKKKLILQNKLKKMKIEANFKSQKRESTTIIKKKILYYIEKVNNLEEKIQQIEKAIVDLDQILESRKNNQNFDKDAKNNILNMGKDYNVEDSPDAQLKSKFSSIQEQEIQKKEDKNTIKGSVEKDGNSNQGGLKSNKDVETKHKNQEL
ncbi:hypoxia up-regulated protein [Anaeramoeba flamelloides]|uniref:Hypoxia up-regulated protein n=1 Tax=Anaeramoeba flamelloides TaxID=1746091 RepID=A0ABQ8XN23_9EUKA|nr:hypoxia up-regulated protein [Anaeramoeba flamelloides]